MLSPWPNCLLLVAPLLAFNAALTNRLPAGLHHDRGVPTAIQLADNERGRPLTLFIVGSVLYLASWAPPLVGVAWAQRLLTIGLLKLLPDRKRVVLTPTMVKYPNTHPDWYRNTLTELLDLAARGDIKPIITEPIPLREAARAHQLLTDGPHAGKIVLTPHT